MQPQVVFNITYSEYQSYVLSLTAASRVKLMTQLQVLSDMATTGHPKLYNCFLQDVAFAIIKELFFATKFGKTASIILPASFSENTVNVSQMLGAYAYCAEAQLELMQRCRNLGYTLPEGLYGQNAILYKLAVVLYSMSMKPTAVKEFNLVYDVA